MVKETVMTQTKMDKDVENVHDKKKWGHGGKKANNREDSHRVKVYVSKAHIRNN
jgi:hypothetical protein